ncbi:MAG: hypothetical protein V1735_04600 [Nanoarchaeota archaeon]
MTQVPLTFILDSALHLRPGPGGLYQADEGSYAVLRQILDEQPQGEVPVQNTVSMRHKDRGTVHVLIESVLREFGLSVERLPGSGTYRLLPETDSGRKILEGALASVAALYTAH